MTEDPTPPLQLEPGLLRLLAPNPSPMTEAGTNSYLLGHDQVCIIDPGPDDPRHLRALLAAIDGRPVRGIVVTHAHRDHSALARALAAATRAPVLAFGDATSGRSPAMQRLAGAGIGGGEGVDAGFAPDIQLRDGESLHGTGWSLRAFHTPGHFGNHLCLEWNGALFTGDLVMGWASSLVSPPDGDLTRFMRSCARMRNLAPRILYPGHGAPVVDAVDRIDWLIAHRRGREAQILAALSDGPASPDALTALIYADTPAALRPAAMRNILAHLIDLAERNVVTAESGSPMTSRYGLT